MAADSTGPAGLGCPECENGNDGGGEAAAAGAATDGRGEGTRPKVDEANVRIDALGSGGEAG